MYMIYVMSYVSCARLRNGLCSNFLEQGWVLCPTKQKKTSFTIGSAFEAWTWTHDFVFILIY